MRALVILTRAGCARTPLLRARLAEALLHVNITATVETIDLDEIPGADARRGYGTPTILLAGVDLFDLPASTSPWPSPS